MRVVTSYPNSFFVAWSVCYFLASVLGVSDKRHVLGSRIRYYVCEMSISSKTGFRARPRLTLSFKAVR